VNVIGREAWAAQRMRNPAWNLASRDWPVLIYEFLSDTGCTSTPGGVAAISQGLSAATPPVRCAILMSTPAGSQQCGVELPADLIVSIPIAKLI
jgi:hypothetical protein